MSDTPVLAAVDTLEGPRPAASPLVLEEYLRSLFPTFSATEPPLWPPDVFALCIAPLWKSASYASVLNHWPPEQTSSVEWSKHAEEIAGRWRTQWQSGSVPQEVVEKWRKAFVDITFPLSKLADHLPQCQLLLELAAIADEASFGLGIPEQEDLSAEEEQFQDHGNDLLADQTEHGASLCEQLDLSRVRVLPKMHCPQSGLTIRSFSHHLAICFGDEIKPMWHQRKLDVESAFNLLVIPWPYVVLPKQFRDCDPLAGETSNIDPEHFGFFTVDHRVDVGEDASTKIGKIVKAAENLIGEIHGVVLPELSLSEAEHSKLEQELNDKGIFLVAGVGIPGDGVHHPANEVRVSFPSYDRVTQHKHHRWKLEEHQISQYGLGSRLDPMIQWWEHISVCDRQLGFFSLLPWLVATVLICEDLARPDPVGDLVRSVGPNLVIALLMDGPQLKERWSARYATSLADDPGSSVLSMTSLGMARLSRPRGTASTANPVVAIWKDAKSGGPVQIDLPPGHHGLVLSISRFNAEEWSADGRSDGEASGYPALTGVHPVKVEGMAV